MKIISAVGARPNFVKLAPLLKALPSRPGKLDHLVCHTGQHYDASMSGVFFRDLGLPRPDFELGVGSGTHGGQTARILEAFEAVLLREGADLVIVVGDVNSTLACGLAAAKLNIPVAHVEAGLRSFDRRMPEEISRKLTDALASYLFVSEPSGLTNLKREGFSRFLDMRDPAAVPPPRLLGADDEPLVVFAGNVMIDSLVRLLPIVDRSKILSDLGLRPGGFVLATFHRPENVDGRSRLEEIALGLSTLGEAGRPVIIPLHPRTKANLEKFGLLKALGPGIRAVDPLGYIDFLALEKAARLVLTDSGGIQEETTFLGVPCLTFRRTTERPVTIERGTNALVGPDFGSGWEAARTILRAGQSPTAGTVPDLWDGRAAERIAAVLSTGVS